MQSIQERGNILVSIVVTGGMIFFVASFINAGIKSLLPKQSKGAVQGVFIAQRVTSTPGPTSYMKINVKNTAGSAVSLTNGMICQGTWGGQVTAGAVSTSNCQYSPPASFSIAFDQYRWLGTFTGIFLKLPPGYSYEGATTPENESDLVSATAKDERGDNGSTIGWYTNMATYLPYSTLNIVVKPAATSTPAPTVTPLPLSAPANLKAQCAADNKNVTLTWSAVTGSTGKYAVVVAYEPYGAVQTRNTAISTGTTYTTNTYWNVEGYELVKYRATVKAVAPGEIEYSPKGAAATVEFACPYSTPTITPSPTPVSTTVLPTGTTPKPTCAQDCSLQPKGDANCSANIDSTDYTLWQLAYLGKEIPVELKNTKIDTDFNKDGKVNLVDLQIWQNGIYTPPPTPQSTCVAPTNAVPTLGAGCYYKQVQCVKAPCDPQVVCPQTTLTPTTLITAKPSAAPTTTLIPTKVVPTNIPAGCYYKQVQCIKAPCDPILVCPTTTQ